MTKAMPPRFNIGDTVTIVSVPYLKCPFGWVDEMDDYCGWETTITDVYWSDIHNTYGYYVACDDEACSWCEDCFVYNEAEIEESESSIDILLE